jgi:hypothetical protein
MKLCKDCKHCVPERINPDWFERLFMRMKQGVYYNYAVCAARSNEATDPVTGAAMSRHNYCAVERMYSQGDMCGPEGKHWEPIQ